MADNKKSIVLYTDLIHTFEELSDQEAGVLIKHVFRYVNDMDPDPPDRLTKIAFEPIKQQLKRDLAKWEGIRGRRAEAGKLGGVRRGENLKQQKANEANASDTKQIQANEAVSVNGNVSVNVNDTVNVTDTVNKDKGVKEKSVSKKPHPPDLKAVAKASFENTDCLFGTPFKNNWLALLKTKKWIKKQQSAIDMSLKQLMKFDEDFAIALVEKAIAGEYQGVVFPDTEAHYEKYNKSKNGQANSRETAIESRSRMYELARTILTSNQA